jgi:Zn-dependent peptidase ImmA (M78 family)/DNA-binding XRE family transcriptional regulator
MKETIAGNLIRYRKGLRLSQERLAEMVGITRQSINNYEKAKTLPDSKTLSALAHALDVTLDELLRPPHQGLPNFRFRVHSSLNPQLAAGVLRMLETYNALEQAVGLPPYAPESTPCYRLEGNEKRISTLAAQFRHRLGIGDAPIFNLFEATEEIGLKVLRQPIPEKNFWGMSACSADQGAFVFVNSHNTSIEGQLFTLAQEIGHLIFHRGEYQDNLMGAAADEKGQAEVANYFASHLLVSQDALERALDVINDLQVLKAHFRVSFCVILTRLEQMGKLNYRDFLKKMRHSYKQRTGKTLTLESEIEPRLSASEFPENQRLKKLVWQALSLGQISEMRAAELLELTVEQLRTSRQETEVYAIA